VEEVLCLVVLHVQQVHRVRRLNPLLPQHPKLPPNLKLPPGLHLKLNRVLLLQLHQELLRGHKLLQKRLHGPLLCTCRPPEAPVANNFIKNIIKSYLVLINMIL
jgi:hypothetical protein